MKKNLKTFYFTWSQYMNPGVPGHHVDMILEAESPSEKADLGGVWEQERQLSMADLEAEGLTLEVIGARLNADTLSQVEKLTADLGEMTKERDALADKLQQAQAELDVWATMAASATSPGSAA